MDAHEAADQVIEARESATGDAADDRFRSRTALLISLMAMLLAISSLGGNNASEDMMIANIQASDTWAFYQAKNIRQTSFRIAADTLEAELRMHQNALPPEVQSDLKKRVDEYRATVTRYDDEPDPKEPDNALKGEGKKQLAARARDFERQRERAVQQDGNFDYAEALFQISVLLASVSILAMSPMIRNISIGVGAVAFLLMINGYLLIV